MVIPTEDVDLANAVYFIAENKKTAKNIADYSNAVSIIRESIKNSNVPNTIRENKDIDKLANSLLEEFNKKYSSELTASEISALKVRILKQFTTRVLMNNSIVIRRINSIIEQISNKEYVLESVGNDICGMIKLSTIFG